MTLHVTEEDYQTLKDNYPSWGGFTSAMRNALHQLAERLRRTEVLMKMDTNQDNGDEDVH